MTICRVCEKVFAGKTRVGVCLSCNQDLELEKIFSGQRTPSYINKEKFFWRDSKNPA